MELTAKDLLNILAGSTVGTRVLAHQIGNASLTDALRVIGIMEPSAFEHLKHFSDLMDTMRAHRNYYAHNIIGTGKPDGLPMAGIIVSLTVKGKMKSDSKLLLHGEIVRLREECDEIYYYGNAIAEIIKSTNDFRLQAPHFSSLEKPKMPKTVEKTRRTLLKPPLPPQSSHQ